MFREQYKQMHQELTISQSLLTTTVKKAEALQKKRRPTPLRPVASTAAALLLFTAGINLNPSFAESLSELPVIGSLVQVLTISNYTEEHPDSQIHVKQPGVEGSEQITLAIEEAIEQYKEKALLDIDAYRQAVLETGGTEEDFQQRNLQVYIDYEIKADTENYLSFVLTMQEDWMKSSQQRHYYNIDAKTGTELTLQDLLGEDYITIANAEIARQIANAPEDAGFFQEESIAFESIEPDTPFYINQAGNPVIVFDYYEIAIGSSGLPEFEIPKPEAE